MQDIIIRFVNEKDIDFTELNSIDWENKLFERATNFLFNYS